MIIPVDIKAGYSQEDWDAVDSPSATPEQLARAKPFGMAFPELAENMRRNLGGRPILENPKKLVSLRLDSVVLEKFKATGKGWQSRMNEVLKQAKL